MAKIKFDVSKVEGGGDFVQPKPGLYVAKVKEAEAGKSKAGNDQLKIMLTITTKGEFKGANLFHYVPTDPDSPGFFRMKEFVTAMGVGRGGKGTLDTDKIIGNEVQVRVKADSFEGEYRARVGSVLPPKSDDDEGEEDEDDEDEDAEEDGEDEDESSEDDDGDESDDEEEGDDEEDDYEEWSVDELRAELKQRGLRAAGKKSVMIGRLRKDDEDDDDPFAS